MHRLTCAAEDMSSGVKGGMNSGTPAIGGTFRTMNLHTADWASAGMGHRQCACAAGFARCIGLGHCRDAFGQEYEHTMAVHARFQFLATARGTMLNTRKLVPRHYSAMA